MEATLTRHSTAPADIPASNESGDAILKRFLTRIYFSEIPKINKSSEINDLVAKAKLPICGGCCGNMPVSVDGVTYYEAYNVPSDAGKNKQAIYSGHGIDSETLVKFSELKGDVHTFEITDGDFTLSFAWKDE